MTTLASGSQASVTIPAGAVLVIPSGTGLVTFNTPPMSAQPQTIGPARTTIGPFQASVTVNILATSGVEYFVGPPQWSNRYTWASLPPAASVAPYTEAFVVDFGVLFYTDGAYWRPVGGRALLSNQLTDITMAVNAAEQVLWSYSIPPGLVFPGASLEFQFNGEKLGGVADTFTFRIKINGNTLTSPSFATTNIAFGATNRFQRTSATTVRKLGGGGATILAPLASVSTAARVAAVGTQDMDTASNTIQVTGQMTTGGTEYCILSGFQCFLAG